ncbi:MAG: diaminopimelate decarboxylase [Longimicrobiales bacterium]
MGTSVLTQPFPRVEGRVVCGEVPLEDLATEYGTPLYVYDLGWIRGRVAAFREAFEGAGPLLAYSVKANGNLTLLRELRALGCGADITSGGELYRAVSAGIDGSEIVFAGVGKSEAEIAFALDEGIYAFNVESRSELERIDRVATEKGMTARFGIRVNPNVLASTPHQYTATGHSETKFGVPWEETRALYRWALGRDALDPIGIDVHIGSQIVDTEPYVQALDRVLGVVTELRQEGVPLEYLDIGGGFGISYGHGPALDLESLAAQIVPRVVDAGLRLVLEPGRSLVGEAGAFLTRVQYVKSGGPKTFVIVDGGMSELIRPSHYGGYHAIEPAGPIGDREATTVDVVGPICETGDFLALDRPIPEPREGELLAVRTSGAYGFSMASNYNGRLRPAEVLVDGAEVRLVRRRETYEDLIRGEA